jgi:glycosyltransferase involved in cell wall biosynthesis
MTKSKFSSQVPHERLKKTPHVFFGPEIWQLQDQGGVSRYFGELIRHVSKIDTRTQAFLPNSNNQYMNLIPRENVSAIKDQREKKIIELADSFEYINDSRRVYHATYYSSLDLKKIENANFSTIITVFDLISEKFSEKKVLSWPRINSREKSIRSANHVICISQTTKNDLLEYYNISEEKISVIHLGSNLQDSSSVTPARPQKNPYILFVGKRRGYKNFDLLLKAFSQIKNLKSDFQVIAFGGGELEASELRTIKSLGIEKNVNQISGDDAVLSALYKGAFALVYPSLYEGFGLPPIEAMKLGCPVIASNGGSIPEICREGAFYFNPSNVDELVSTLEESLSNPAMFSQNVLKGQIISEGYTWEKTAFETYQVYRQL